MGPRSSTAITGLAILALVAVGALWLSQRGPTTAGRGIAQTTTVFDYQRIRSEPRPYCGVPLEDASCGMITERGRGTELNSVEDIPHLLDMWRLLQQAAGPVRFATAPGIRNELDRVSSVLRSHWLTGQYNVAAGGNASALFDDLGRSTTLGNGGIPEARVGAASTLMRQVGAAADRNLRSVLSWGSSGQTDSSARRRLLTTLAGMWWGSRQVALAAACPRGTLAGDSGKNLVILQYAAQSCRRDYMELAITALNRRMTEEGRLTLDSDEWLVAMVFGSRRERAALIAVAADRLRSQLEGGQLMSNAELGFMGASLLATVEELRRRQVLAWTGPSAFDEEGMDSASLSTERDALQRFVMSALMRAGRITSNVEDEVRFARKAREVWNGVEQSATREEWVRLGADSIWFGRRDTLESLRQSCVDGLEGSCAQWLAAVPAAEAENRLAAPELWVRLLTAGPMGIRDFNGIVEAFLGRVRGASGREASRAWQSAAVTIGQWLRQQVEVCLGGRDGLMPILDYMNCIAAAEWRRWIAARRLPTDLDEILVSSSCSSPDRARHWTRQLLVLHASLYGVTTPHGTDNVLAAVMRHRIWVNLASTVLRDRTRREATAALGTGEWQRRQSRAWDCYFHDGSGCFDESERRTRRVTGEEMYVWLTGSSRLERLWMKLDEVMTCTTDCTNLHLDPLY